MSSVVTTPVRTEHRARIVAEAVVSAYIREIAPTDRQPGRLERSQARTGIGFSGTPPVPEKPIRPRDAEPSPAARRPPSRRPPPAARRSLGHPQVRPRGSGLQVGTRPRFTNVVADAATI